MVDVNRIVVCVDVGSVRRKRFAWASDTDLEGAGPDGLEAQLRSWQAAGAQVALGFECPGWVPVPMASIDLGSRRSGEGRYPWSAGAGSGALATGIAQIAWILRSLSESPGGSGTGSGIAPLTVTTSRRRWEAAVDGEWLLWEAFLAGERKPAPDQVNPHVADAKAGLEAFREDQRINNGEADEDAVNLLALLAHWAGLTVPAQEWHDSLPIYGPALAGTGP